MRSTPHTMVQSDALLHGQLPGFLHFLAELDNEAEGKDGGEAVAEVETRADALLKAAIEPQTYDEKE